MMAAKIKGWAKFQHFKDRRPPWIKLYRDILEDPDWHDLDGDTAKVLVALWLIASEDEDQEGKLPDTRRLAFRLRLTETKVNQALTKLSHWLERDDNDLISSGYQHDAPETETETEKRQKKETETKTLSRPVDVSEQVWHDFVQQRKHLKAPVNETALAGIRREAQKAGWSLQQALVECTVRGWRGFKADWVKTEAEKKMTVNQASNLAFARAVFGDERNLTNDTFDAIDITPGNQAPAGYLGAEDL
jgi:hypothetical protein